MIVNNRVNRFRGLTIGLLLIVQCCVYGQQGPQFTQFMFNNLAINPAYAGSDEALSLTAISRSQWNGVDKAPSTQAFSAHTLYLKRVGLGLNIVNDRIGVHKNLNAMASYAYHIPTGRRSYISLGLQAGVGHFKSDYPSLDPGSMDPKLYNYVNQTKLDVGAGLYFRSPLLDVGASVLGLLSRRVYLNDTLAIKLRNADLLLYSRYRVKLNHQWVFEPAILVKYYYGLPFSFDVNGSFIYKRVLTGGLSYRRNESVDFIFKVQLTPRMQFGYAYDYPIRSVSLMSTASHEVMLNYVFRKIRKNIMSPR